ncbi:MAG: hypothetical protein WD448_11830 [Woeseia sp.]
MGRYGIIAMAAGLAGLLAMLFELHFNPVFSLPRTVEQADAEQRDRYDACVSNITDRATREALEAADNPDVQSLMIRMRQKEAVSECRERFPQRVVTVEEPLRINLIDLEWRY